MLLEIGIHIWPVLYYVIVTVFGQVSGQFEQVNCESNRPKWTGTSQTGQKLMSRPATFMYSVAQNNIAMATKTLMHN